MDQSIKQTLTQCAGLQNQANFANRLLVPFSVEYHFEEPSVREPALTDTLDITAQGQLRYEPARMTRLNTGGGASIGIDVVIPDSLSATVSGQTSITVVGAGGFDGASDIEITITGPVPLATFPASVTFQCRDFPGASIQFDVDANTPPPIRLVRNDGGRKTTLTLHLGAAAVLFVLPSTVREVPLARVG